MGRAGREERRALVILAAADCDAHVAELPDVLAQAAVDAGMERALDRSVHRALHLDPVEAALADDRRARSADARYDEARSPDRASSLPALRAPLCFGLLEVHAASGRHLAASRALGSGLSVIMASVVRTIAAIDAAFSTAERVTLAGSTMPALSMSTYSPVMTL